MEMVVIMMNHKKTHSIFICIFIIIVLSISFYIPCYIWNIFKHFDKTEFFGDYYGSLISAMLALGGVAISLIFSNYQTRKSIINADNRARRASQQANEHTRIIISESKKKLKAEELNNLEIQLMIVNYQTLNKLNSHLQKLDASFTNANISIKDIEVISPSADDIMSANAVLNNIEPTNTSSDIVDNFLNKFPQRLADDINSIMMAVKTYKIFYHVYDNQIRNLFRNTPSTSNFSKQKKEMNNKLDNIRSFVLSGVEYYLNNLLKNENITDSQIQSCVIYMKTNISNTIRTLSSINNLSFKFGKNLEDYIRNRN